MRKYCAMCRDSFSISRRDYKTIHNDFDIFCSHKCLMRFVLNGNKETIKTCRKPLCMYGQVGKRSSYEGIVEDYFGIYGIRSVYEPFAIRLNDGRRYTPDFYLPDCNMMIEVKGIWASKGKQKLSEVLDAIPKGSLVLIPSYIVKQMRKVCRKLR